MTTPGSLGHEDQEARTFRNLNLYHARFWLYSVVPVDFRNLDKFSRMLDVNAANVEKNTPLHWACLNGHVQVVQNLILARANASLLNSHERTPIDETVSRGKLDVVDAINAAAAQVELSGTSMS